MVFNIELYEWKIFELISKVVMELGFLVYVVGGYVWDCLLACFLKDMDIVCVGSGIDLVWVVVGCFWLIFWVIVFKCFGIVMFKYWDMEIEFVGVCKEFYCFDFCKFIVEEGMLEED